MIEYHLTYAKAATRLAEVIERIVASHEWEQYSRRLSDLAFMDALEPFRHFFDVYEGGDGEEWLGIMESMVVEEMRLRGPSFAADPVTIDAIVARMEHHPNVRLER